MPRKLRSIASDKEIHFVLRTAERIATSGRRPQIPWTLIGGLALRAHGVPRMTVDADILVATNELRALGQRLVDVGWTPIRWDYRKKDYVTADDFTIQRFDNDLVLKGLPESPARQVGMLESPDGMPVDLLAAQHPFEQQMLRDSKPKELNNHAVETAPIGGILLAKMLANRGKDRLAVIQAAEYLTPKQLKDAVTWAYEWDTDAASELRNLIAETRKQLVPNRQRRTR